MRFSATVDPQLFPNADELKVFLEGIVNEIHLLAEAYGVQDFDENIEKIVPTTIQQTGIIVLLANNSSSLA